MNEHDDDDVLPGPSIEPEPGQRFALVPEWLIDAGVSARALRVYAGLSIYWSDWSTGECWPRRSVIAAKLRTSVDTVDRAIAELVTLGGLRVQERHRPDGSRASNKLWIQRVPPPGFAAVVQGGGRRTAEGVSADSRGQERDPIERSILPATVPRDSLAASTSTAASTPVDNEPDTYDAVLGALRAAITWAEHVDGVSHALLDRQVVADVGVCCARLPAASPGYIAALVAAVNEDHDRDLGNTLWPTTIDVTDADVDAWARTIRTTASCAPPSVASRP